MPLHAWLAGFADGPQFDPQCDLLARIARIDADLADAGYGSPITPDGDAWPAAASPAYRWGVHYVIEGSQLGGAVLYKRLYERLAPHRLSYLQGDDAGPGPRWRGFMQALRAGVRSPAEIADACAGACAAFDRILELRVGSRTGAA
jgi:heme oxygenase